MLNRRLSNTKWTALGVLTIGIALVVLPKGALQSWMGYEPLIVSDTNVTSIGNQSNSKGLVSVCIACILSGIAGVYFEKIVKSTQRNTSLDMLEKQKNTEQIQLWIRNIQLSIFSVLFGCIFVVALQDGPAILQDGFFQNYSYLTWIVIFIQAGGGLIVGFVVRYADNILKGFATSISIILSSVISIFLFNFEVTLSFSMGALLVIYATYMYGSST